MNARVLIAIGAIAALVTPTAATAKLIPVKHPTTQAAKHVATHNVAPRVPRVLCICVTIPAGAFTLPTEVELEAQNDVELIAHGLEPSYVSFQTTPALQAQYDAVLAKNGLSPYFGAAPTG
jgi:hypothetical protein